MLLKRCDPVFRILDNVLLSCQNAVTLEAAHKLLRTLTSNPKLSSSVDTTRLLAEVLDDIGFSGLWRSSTFHTADDQDKSNTILIDKLIEVKYLIILRIPPNVVHSYLFANCNIQLIIA